MTVMSWVHRLSAALTVILMPACPSHGASSEAGSPTPLVECGDDYRATRDAQIMVVTMARIEGFEVCVRALWGAALRCVSPGQHFTSLDVTAGEHLTARVGRTMLLAACAARYDKQDLAWPVATLADPRAVHVHVFETSKRSSSLPLGPPARGLKDVLGPPVFRCDQATRAYLVEQAGHVTTIPVGWSSRFAGASLCAVRDGISHGCIVLRDPILQDVSFEVQRGDELRLVTRDGTTLPARLCPAPMNSWHAEWSVDDDTAYDMIDDRPPADISFTFRFAPTSKP